MSRSLRCEPAAAVELTAVSTMACSSVGATGGVSSTKAPSEEREATLPAESIASTVATTKPPEPMADVRSENANMCWEASNVTAAAMSSAPSVLPSQTR